MSPERLAEITSRYRDLRIAVVGDYCLDRYVEIDPERSELSIETGLPVHNIVSIRAQAGAAGTIANNLSALGIGEIIAVGICGDDGEGFELRRALAGLPGMKLDHFHTTSLRRTFTYAKPLLQEPGHSLRELNRFDTKNWTPTPPEIEAHILDSIAALPGSVDAVIIMDQVDVPGTGVVTTRVRTALGQFAGNVPVIADSRRSLHGFLSVILKMNAKELGALTGLDHEASLDSVARAARQLAIHHRHSVFVTLAERGIIGADAAGNTDRCPALPLRGPIDIVGAGDAVTANLAAALAGRGTQAEAMELAMLASSIAIHQLGTTGTASIAQIADLHAQPATEGELPPPPAQCTPVPSLNSNDEIGSALDHERERLLKIAATAPGAIYSYRQRLDGGASFPYASAAFRELFGIDPKEVAENASAVFARVHPDDLATLMATIETSAAQLSTCRKLFRIRHPVKGDIWIEGHSLPVREADGSFLWHGYLADITARKHAEDEVRRLNAELERRVEERAADLEIANRELEAFSYSVSHDLRAPLRAITGFADMVMEDLGQKLPPESQRHLESIQRSAQRIAELIDDLVSFSRLTRVPMQKAQVDMADLVRTALTELHSLQEGRNVVIQTGELPPCVGDASLLRQVWINLIANALKYTRHRDAATIAIGAESHAGEVTYFVQDNGTGFDLAHASKLFGVFQRFHRSEDFEGNGVGLAIAQRIVHRHGGHIWAESARDEGAAFFFKLKADLNSGVANAHP